jgi:hypothetical protein
MLTMTRRLRALDCVAGLAAAAAFSVVAAAASSLGGPLPGPLPLFPPDNWWNLDVSSAPVDPGSTGYIAFINNGSARQMHPDFGGDVSPGSVQTYGFPYIVVDDSVVKSAVTFQYADESDGVDHATGSSYDVLNPAFRSLTANDFDVIHFGYAPPPPAAPTGLRILSSW